jgi:hypothetical protein
MTTPPTTTRRLSPSTTHRELFSDTIRTVSIMENNHPCTNCYFHGRGGKCLNCVNYNYPTTEMTWERYYSMTCLRVCNTYEKFVEWETSGKPYHEFFDTKYGEEEGDSGDDTEESP